MTLIIVAGTFLSPCCITYLSCSPMCVTIVLYFTDSGCILILWYPSVKSSLDLNFLAAVQFIISFILNYGVGSGIVIAFLGIQSTRNLGSTLFPFGLVNMNTQSVDWDTLSLPVLTSWFILSVIWYLNLCNSHISFGCHVLPGSTLLWCCIRCSGYLSGGRLSGFLSGNRWGNSFIGSHFSSTCI